MDVVTSTARICAEQPRPASDHEAPIWHHDERTVEFTHLAQLQLLLQDHTAQNQLEQDDRLLQQRQRHACIPSVVDMTGQGLISTQATCNTGQLRYAWGWGGG